MTKINISHEKTCDCPINRISCISAKEWAKCQLGVWRFNYEKRDVRKRDVHPATFPISMANRVISLFTHEGELVLDPFVGSGTTLVAAQDLNRNAVGFELNTKYIETCLLRLSTTGLFNNTQQIVINDDARNVSQYLSTETVKLVFTSPPYANILNHPKKNLSKRNKKDGEYQQILQYSNDPRDIGNLDFDNYIEALCNVFALIHPILRHDGHCVINVSDIWAGKRYPIHIAIINEFQKYGYTFKNIIIWDKTNIVNKIGIFGWPKNYITMSVSFEYLIHFEKH